jgi:hypothetical protein
MTVLSSVHLLLRSSLHKTRYILRVVSTINKDYSGTDSLWSTLSVGNGLKLMNAKFRDTTKASTISHNVSPAPFKD